MSFGSWRATHKAAAAVLGVLALVHSSFTLVAYEQWSPDAVWFLGTGLGLLLLALGNWSHVGLEPCNLPTAPVIRWANFVFLAFALTAVVAVPQPQAYLILVAIAIQAVAGLVTLRPSA